MPILKEKDETGLVIRTMTRKETEETAIEWAAAEGWNPGLYDLAPFYETDPEGFIMGEVKGRPVGCISVVAYEGDFGFLGFYIVKPEFRGKGFGIKIWNEALKHLEGKNVGLDGVVAQQENYKKSGCRLAYRNIRFEGNGIKTEVPGPVSLKEIPFELIADYDRKFFPAERNKFLQLWINEPEGNGYALISGGKITGYGFIRKCRKGYKIGPLFADDFSAAEKLFLALRGNAEGDAFYLDIPEANKNACMLVEKYGMTKVFETARMYTKTAPALPVDNIYGVTSFELG